VRLRPRFFSRALSRRQRVVYGAATAWFLAVFVGTCWPVYPLFSRIHPLLLGMPLSLFYLLALLVLSFGVAVGLFVWELRGGDSAAGGRPED
jgi:hypothetical protein